MPPSLAITPTRKPFAGCLNAGYRRSGRATLCVGHGASIGYRDFATFSPKAIAGLGGLPDTVASRAIRIDLKRRRKDEVVEKFREREARTAAAPIRRALAAWGERATETLRAARPSMPHGLRDRTEDVLEPECHAARADVTGRRGSVPLSFWSVATRRVIRAQTAWVRQVRFAGYLHRARR